ncbi:MAG TPA: DUF2079 domain-containing protein [Acidothermaceae bacterium]|jgi:uncharacterized membrane protein
MLDISDPAGTADQSSSTGNRTRRIGTAISGPIHRLLTPDVAGVTALTAATATLYTVFEIEQQRHFQTAGYDLGIFDQAISGYAHLHAPISLMKGVHNGFGTHFSELGDHFSPIIATVAPVYRVFPSAVTLLVVQGLLFAASLPSVWLFSRRALGRPAAYLITAAYALAWGLQAAMAADFHEIAFAVPLIAIALERLDAGRLRSAVIAALLLLLVKEDFGLVVAAFGLVVGLRTHRWRLGAVLAVVGIAFTVLADRVLIPAFGGKAGYYWDYYAALGSGPLEAAWHVVRHPLWTLHLMVTPQAKVRLLEWLFLPLGLMPLGSSFVLLTVPLLAERLLSDNPNHWTLTHQYTAPFVPILTLAAVDTVAKIRRALQSQTSTETGRRTRAGQLSIGPAYAVGILVIAVWAWGRMPFGELTHNGITQSWHTTSYDQARQAAVDVVPNGATVEASNELAPHLVDRTKVMLLDATPHDAPWVVFDEGYIEFPMTDQSQDTRRSWLLSHGYQQLFSRDAIVVYHRVGAASTP